MEIEDPLLNIVKINLFIFRAVALDILLILSFLVLKEFLVRGNTYCSIQQVEHSGNSTFADKLKETLKEIEVIEKKKRTSGHKRGKCPYCSSTFEFSRQLKFIECTKCEQVSMQDGVTRSLYK